MTAADFIFCAHPACDIIIGNGKYGAKAPRFCCICTARKKAADGLEFDRQRRARRRATA